MYIAQEHCHGGGRSLLSKIWHELTRIVGEVDAEGCIRRSKERLTLGKELYAPARLNKQFARLFKAEGWAFNHRERFGEANGSYLECDYLKDQVLAEVQFGKYAFVHTDMIRGLIFAARGVSTVSVEIVPSDELHRQLSSGVPCFRQARDVLCELGSRWPIPTMVLGISA